MSGFGGLARRRVFGRSSCCLVSGGPIGAASGCSVGALAGSDQGVLGCRHAEPHAGLGLSSR